MSLPIGFQFAGICCGLKPSGNLDMAVVATRDPCVAAGVYTQNVVRAASIDWNRAITPSDDFRGLVINSGNANACTGLQGSQDNQQMAVELAKAIHANPDQCGVLSTGVIGEMLNMQKVVPGIVSAVAQLGASRGDFDLASRAILTTDKSCKTAQSILELNAAEIRIAAMAKGAGMIGPNMATMLAVILTDAELDSASAQLLLERVVAKSFNCISVEGHTSTNDAVILLASGASKAGRLGTSELRELEAELTSTCVDLAKMIPADGEGASKLISISIDGAANDESADAIARCIAQSALVKTAVSGCDPNWGRIVSAAGYSGVHFDPEKSSLRVNGFELFRNGTPVEFKAGEVSEAIRTAFETTIEFSIGTGPGSAQHWTSDLTVDYVRFNSEYHT